MTKVILFDFGGTLDTNGIHWSEKFWDTYLKFGVPVAKNQFEEAYRASEKNMNKLVNPNDSFEATIFYQVSGQLTYLKQNKLISGLEAHYLTKIISDSCYKDVIECSKDNAKILTQLKTKYQLGIVSNFYGNLEHALKELGIKKYFDVIIDSRDVGVEKPDPRIFQAALNRLGVSPADAMVVGDSYERDIQPAKKLGCTTMWLDGKSWRRPADTSDADFIIKSLFEIIIYS